MLVSFSMIPLDKGAHFSPYVARLLKIIRESGLPHELTAMATIVEGDWDEVFGLIKECREELRKDSDRVSIKIWVDDKAGGVGMLKGKPKSVLEKLDDPEQL
ncbi:MAG: MTH1187 family thiamine-binding protein, partial [bacterium]